MDDNYLILEKPRPLSEVVWKEGKCFWRLSLIHKIFAKIVHRVYSFYQDKGVLILNVAPDNICVWREGNNIEVDIIDHQYCVLDGFDGRKPLPPERYEFLAPECHLWSDDSLNERTICYNLACLLFWMCNGISWYKMNRHLYRTPYFHDNLISIGKKGCFYKKVLQEIVYNNLMLDQSKRYSLKGIFYMLQLKKQ